MIQVADELWIGNSVDGYNAADIRSNGIRGVLNVAQDLRGGCSWPGVDYMQVGLIDGPGNEVVVYCSAVLAVVSLFCRHKSVLVHDHDGGRALVVVAMYTNLVGGKYRPGPTAWSRWMSWGERLVELEKYARTMLPRPHPAHVDMFAKIPFGLMEAFL